MSDSRYATRTGSQSDATYDACGPRMQRQKRKARRSDEREAQIVNCARGAISIVECQRMTPYIGMSDVAPRRLHISRHYGCPFCRTPRTEDGRHVLAGLLARGSNASSDLPNGPEHGTVSGVCGVSLPLTVAGAATASGKQNSPYRVPFSPSVREHRWTSTSGNGTDGPRECQENCMKSGHSLRPMLPPCG